MKANSIVFVTYTFICRMNYSIVKILSRIGALLIIMMSIIIFAQVIMRYLFSNPFEWAEEITIYMMIYMTLICMPYLVIMNKNIAMTIFYDKISGTRIGFIFDFIIVSAFMIVVLLWSPIGIQLFLDSREILAAQMSITRDWLYSSIPISFVFTIIACLQRIMRSIVCIIHPSVHDYFLEIEKKFEKSERKHEMKEGEIIV